MGKKSMSFQEVIDSVRQFHDAFKINNESEPTVDVGEKVIKLRYDLMHEENEEYLEAAKSGDLVEVADALGDMLYILCGTMLAHGMQNKIESNRSNTPPCPGSIVPESLIFEALFSID